MVAFRWFVSTRGGGRLQFNMHEQRCVRQRFRSLVLQRNSTVSYNTEQLGRPILTIILLHGQGISTATYNTEQGTWRYTVTQNYHGTRRYHYYNTEQLGDSTESYNTEQRARRFPIIRNKHAHACVRMRVRNLCVWVHACVCTCVRTFVRTCD